MEEVGRGELSWPRARHGGRRRGAAGRGQPVTFSDDLLPDAVTPTSVGRAIVSGTGSTNGRVDPGASARTARQPRAPVAAGAAVRPGDRRGWRRDLVLAGDASG